MKPIDPAELSGFLDGEMTEERRQEIQRSVADTARLREELQSLASADSRWRVAARAAAFDVEVGLKQQKQFMISAKRAALFIGLLLAIRLVPKLTDILALGLVLNGIALALVIAWIIAMIRETGDRKSASI